MGNGPGKTPLILQQIVEANAHNRSSQQARVASACTAPPLRAAREYVMSIADCAAEAPSAPWPELDPRLLQTGRRAVPPPFPLEVIAEAWRPWIEGHAQASTCTDYTAQALLAAVAAGCGSRFVVDVAPWWREPLVLWQALVGAPSTGKTAALVAARRLLAGVKAPPDPAVADYKMAPDELPLTPWMVHRGI